MTIKSWTDYFLDMAKTCSSRSNCLRAQVGAVVVGQDKKIKAVLYFGITFGAYLKTTMLAIIATTTSETMFTICTGFIYEFMMSSAALTIEKSTAASGVFL